MAKVVLASFTADTPVDPETAQAANESASKYRHELPFPGGQGLMSTNWFLVVDTDSGAVTATRDPAEAYGTTEQDTEGAQL